MSTSTTITRTRIGTLTLGSACDILRAGGWEIEECWSSTPHTLDARRPGSEHLLPVRPATLLAEAESLLASAESRRRA